MRKVFTITANLLSEYTLQLESSKVPTKGTHRAVSTSHQVGGKGINVSRALNSLGQANIAICLPAGKEGEKCVESLKAESVDIAPIYIEGETRIASVIRTNNANKEVSYFSTDINPSSSDFKKIITYIEKNAKKGDIIAICGSIPNFKDSFGESLLELVEKKALSLCVDTYGKALKFFSDKKLLLLKINKDELLGLELLNKNDKTKDNFLALAKISKANFLAITNGAKPALLYADNIATKHKVRKVKLKSATGCGDLTFAYMINAILNGAVSIRQAFEASLEYATNTAIKKEENAHI
ncbi:MAG: PfkB family carbohydrate kinase [Opitutales bacterium]